MKNRISLLSLLLAALMIFSLLAACAKKQNNITSTSEVSADKIEETEKQSDQQSEAESAESSSSSKPEETDSSEDSSEIHKGEESQASEVTDINTETEAVLDCDNAQIITGSNQLANQVNAYFSDGNRKHFITENMNMLLSYSNDMLSDRKVSSLTDKNGNVYIENTMDIFVKMNSGDIYYASKAQNSAKVSQFAGINIFRFGYYYYDVRFEDQNFVNDIKVTDELQLDIKGIESEVGLKSKYGSDGLFCYLSGNSIDPQVIFKNISFETSDYNYLAITMKSDIGATNEADCQFFIKTTAENGYKNVSFDTVNDGEFHTYYVYIGNMSNYGGTLTSLRLDLSMSYATSGGTVEIKEIKAVKADVGNAPQNLGVARVFHTYSDKLHQELQFSAKKDQDGIAEVGMITNISADTVAKVIVKDKNGKHTSLEDVDPASLEYIGFDIKDAGIFGYILPHDCTDTLTVTLNDGVYTVIQSVSPENGTILSSEKGSGNANDLHMGQRIYTDTNHSFDKFLAEAENERTPLGIKNFSVNTEGSTSAEYLGYDSIRGCYTFSLAGTTFSPAYFEYPNRHFTLSFDARGDKYDRTVYVMSTTRPYGHLEAAVLLNKNDMLIPVPIQVSKNFLGDGEANLYNIDDEAYGESILPITLSAYKKDTYKIVNIYQNWGQYPVKQLSSVQYFVPYYHLSTGVTETNCLKPWYYTSIARDHWNLPDHRAWSAPFWHTIPGHSGGSQPQHTLGGAHYFLEYTNSDGERIITENIKNTVISSGPSYAEVISDYISDDGKIKVSYTHTEMPQTDENRTYYQIKYEILDDISIKNFKTDFSFYAAMDQIGRMGYTQIGYLDESNQSRVVSISGTNADKYYTLGDKCPYISYFNNPNSKDYVNISFLIYNSDITVGGEKCKAPFVLVDRGNDDMKKIALTLDLADVTLKAGDSFVINAILMPWGSQQSIYDGSDGKAPDQNVRDVRENSLLDPFKGEAIANCEVVESTYLPTFRTTNGRSAEFKLSGGENNVAVRVYGFDMLTVPKIYELVDGEWQEYVVSSKNTPDQNGYRHYYDGYGVYYDGDGTFSYSFVTTLEGDAERTFKIAADETFKSWPKEEENLTNKINVYKSAEDLYNAASIKVFFDTIELDENKDYLRLIPKDTASEAYFTAFSGDGANTGAYLVFKYRIPSTNVVKKDTIEIFASTKNAAETGGDNFNVVLDTDGEWHIAIIDLTKAGIPNGFEAEKDKTYRVKYVRFDPFNGKTPTTEAFDMAYMALIDDLKKIALFNSSVEYATLYEGNKRTQVATATGETVDSNIEYISPESGYKSSDLVYATHLDMINGMGGASASFTKRGGNSVSGIDTFEHNGTTMCGSYLIFSGWTVVEGGIEKYVWSADGGKTWNDMQTVGRDLGTAAQANLDFASVHFLGGYKFTDTEGSLKNAVYQSPTGLGDGTKGLYADLCEFSGETVDVTFAAVPLSDTSSLCLIAHVTGVKVLAPADTYIHPDSEYKESSVAYATHLDMINGMGGDAASYSMRGGNSISGIDVFQYNGTAIGGYELVFSGWTVAEGGIEKYVWSADGGKTWNDTSLRGRSLGIATQSHLDLASSKFLDNYKFTDTEASLTNAVYQSPTGLGDDVKGVSADLSEFAGQTVNVTFACIPTNEPDSLCLIAHVFGVEVSSAQE